MYSLDDSTFDVRSVEYELYRGAAGHLGAVLAPYPICKVSCCGVTFDGWSVFVFENKDLPDFLAI